MLRKYHKHLWLRFILPILPLGLFCNVGFSLEYPVGDLTRNYQVDVVDLSALLAQWLHEGSPEGGLVAHWQLDEAGGSVAGDRVGGFDGIVEDSPLWQPEGGKLKGALRFDGMDDYVRVPYDPNLNPVNFSVSFWIKPSENAGIYRTLLSSTSKGPLPEDNRTGFILSITSDKKLAFFTGMGPLSEGPWDVLLSNPIGREQWMHVAATFESSSGPNTYGAYTGIKKLFLNGVEIANSFEATYLPNTSQDLILGKLSSQDGTYFEGLLDDVRLYDRALEPSEIAVLASLGTVAPGGGDFNGIGGVNMQDYAILSSGWGDSFKPIVINEVMARNEEYVTDIQGEYDDWIELYNTGTETIDVAGMYLTDDLSNPTKWQVPLNHPGSTILPPSGHVVIWADEDVLDLGFHANFKLDADTGETLALFDTDGTTLVDLISFGVQREDISFGRLPDASDNLQYMTTPSNYSTNVGPGYTGIVEEIEFSFDRGVYQTGSFLTMDCVTEGAEIRYTTNGSDPSPYSTLYDPQPLWSPTEGQIDGALAFDMTYNKTKVPYHNELNTPSFTASFWIRLGEALDLSGCPLGNADKGDPATPNNTGYMILISSYELWQFYTGTGDSAHGYWDVINGPSVPIGSWVHVAASFSATSGPDGEGRYTGVQKFYVGGIEVGSNPSAEYIPNSTRGMTIGQLNFIEGATFRGLMDDVRIYERALEEPEVADLANLLPGVTSGLVSHWKLDEEGGWVVHDATGNHNGQMVPGFLLDKTTTLRASAFYRDWLPSDIATQTYVFLDKVVRQSPDGSPPGPGWPSGTVNDQILDYGMDPDVVYHPDYEDDIDDALVAIPSISLVTELSNLFDPLTGIYVNAQQEGPSWERPVSMEILYPDGREGIQIDAGLRIRGGYSRTGNNPKHAFRLFFRKEYGPGKLHYPLFEDEGVDEFDNIDLRCSQNYSWSFDGSPENTCVREVFSRDLQGEMGQPYTRSRYYHLYLNGQYWGLYMTQERSEASYAESYFGGLKEDYDVIKVEDDAGYTITATDGTTNIYYWVWWKGENEGFTSDAPYYGIQGLYPDGTLNPTGVRKVDIDNLIDCMLNVFYVGDYDSPVSNFLGNDRPNNYYAIYNRVHPDGFKFFRHDAEHTWNDYNGWGYDRTGPFPAGDQFQYFNPQWLHQRLAEHPEYRVRIGDRAHKYFFNNGLMTPAVSQARMLRRAQQIEMAIIAESARWGDSKVSSPYTKAHWEAEVNKVLYSSGDPMNPYYIPARTDLVVNQLRSKGWYPSVAAPVFSIGGVYQHGGEVAEDNNELSMDNPNGSGTIYYTLDGRDPRQINTGNAVGTVYSGPIFLTQSSHAKARVLQGGTWSALNEAKYGMGPVAENLRITEIMYHPADPNLVGYTREDFEFIELKNIGASAIKLAFAAFTKGIHFTFPIPEPSTLLDLGFDSDAEGFTYGDDTFNGTSNPSFATGSYEPSGGATGGGLGVYLGPGPTGSATSGGWSRDFVLDSAGAVNVRVNYRLIISEEYEDTEYGEAILEIDGTRYGSDLNDSLVHLAGGDGGAVTSTVLITEMSPDSPDYMEIQNVAAIPVDTTGWVVALNDASSNDINEVHTIYWDLPSSMAANEIFYRTDDFGENYWGENIWWTSREGSWAMIVDDAGNVVDFVVRGYSETDIAGMNVTINGFPVSGSTAWTGASSTSSSVLARIGNSDNNIATDFENQTDSRGTQNPGLTTPFIGVVITDSGWRTASFIIPQLSTGAHTLTIGGYNNLATSGDEFTEIFIDDVSIDLLPTSKVLMPGEYTVLASNLEAFELLYGTDVDIAGEYTGLLENNGEEIVLEDALGQVIHDFDYDDGWYEVTDGLGFSLTIRDPNSTDPNDWDEKDGWRAGFANGGSPGWDDSDFVLPAGAILVNELLAHSDTEPSDWVEFYNTSESPINIGGWFISDNDTDLMKYEIEENSILPPHGYAVFYADPNFGPGSVDPGSHTGFALSENGEKVYLTSGSGGALTGVYSTERRFYASEADVAFGHYVKSTGTDFVAMSSNTPGVANTYPKVGPVVMNEIAYNPDSDGDAEFVEFLNVSGDSVTLYDSVKSAQWRFVDDWEDDTPGLEYFFPEGSSAITLDPNEYFLLVKNEAAFETVFLGGNDIGTLGVQWDVWGDDGGLNNGGEQPELQKPGDLVGLERQYIRVDRVKYSDGSHPVGDDPWPTEPDDSDTYTLQRRVATDYGNDVINWDWDPYPTHTAGVANPNP
jgi:concanavalin A-like lectin/glucanase superfamily protein/CotH protein/lamin tail-like protein/chitobiase/beta-hexosaminidase-like protein/Fn3 domain-containing protein